MRDRRTDVTVFKDAEVVLADNASAIAYRGAAHRIGNVPP
jgi:hypothetical protein